MGLTEALKREFCFYPIKGDDKQSVLDDLTSRFASEYGCDEDEEATIRKAVFDREALCSTGLENGIAIPHAKLDSIKETVVALGVGEKDIDFGSADGSRTGIYFLVLGSAANPSEHVMVLAQIARLAKSTALLKAIRNARSGEEIADLVL